MCSLQKYSNWDTCDTWKDSHLETCLNDNDVKLVLLHCNYTSDVGSEGLSVMLYLHWLEILRV